MTLWTNGFNGYTPGTAITSSNSGGTNGTAFTVASPPSGGTLTAESAAAHEGAAGMQLVWPSTSVNGYAAWWSVVGSGNVRISSSFWFKFSALPAATDYLLDMGSPNLAVSPSGQILARTGTAVIGTATAAAPGTWLFIQFAITTGTSGTDGRIECNVVTESGTVLLTADSGNTVNAGGGGGGVDVTWGRRFNAAAAYTTSYDLLAVDNTLTSGFPGPAAPLPVDFTGTAAFTGAGSLTATGAVTGGSTIGSFTGSGTLTTTADVFIEPLPFVPTTGINVVANIDSEPPRFEITIVTPDSLPMTEISLRRTVSGITDLTRVQPSPGLAVRYVEDYEEPWGVDVIFTATVRTATGAYLYTADPAQLNPTAAWAIHPLTPALSVCIDRQDNDTTGVVGIQTVSRAAQSTQHQILGAANPITTRTGPRASTRGTMQVQTVTDYDETRLWTLVDDQTPLVIQFPPTWGVGWAYGYYDIGDVSADRVLQWSVDPRRIFTLPFTVVDKPAGAQQSSWDYPSLLHDFADYPAVLAAFTDYPALIANTRN